MNTVIQHADHEMINVGNELKQKIPIKGMGGIDTVAIANAEAALDELSVNFDAWLDDEVNTLVAARDAVRRHGLKDEYFEELFRVAHDVKGEGETLGYPLATIIAASLCKLLDTPEKKTVIPQDIIDNHVDALRLVARDRIKGRDNPAASAVADRLVEVVLDYVEREEAKQK